MEEKHEIKLILSVNRLVSVNAMYSSKIMNGRAVIYKTGEAKRAEAYIKEQIRALDIPKNYPWVNEDTLFIMNTNLILNSGFLARDVDNIQKNLIDGIFRGMGLNDSHIIRIYSQKTLCKDLKDEKVCVLLKEFTSQKELNLSYIPKPEVIWSSWKNLDDLGIKELGKRRMKDTLYYSTSKSNANTKLYVLDPTDGIEYTTFMDILSDITENIVDSTGLAYIAILGTKDSWGDTKWSALEEFSKRLDKIGKESYSGIRYRFLETKEKILEWLKEG